MKSEKTEKYQTNQTSQINYPCSYVRLHAAVPKQKKVEPVFELAIPPADKKEHYLVESINYTEHGVIWVSGDETNIIPLANVVFARLIK